MEDPRHQLGRAGEKLAEDYLRGRGLKLLERRFSTPAGEIDLIMRDGGTLVFVEVKTRSDEQYARPQDAVGLLKQRRLLRAARWYLARRGLAAAPCRCDVVAVVFDERGQPHLTHLAGAFTPPRW